MANIARFACSWQVDSAAPTDQLMINPHFHVASFAGASPDWQALCDDLSAALNTWSTAVTQLTVTAYAVEGPPPHYPLAKSVQRLGTINAAAGNRDIAVCLSYYADVNRPRHRGRLYVPAVICGLALSGAFVSAASMTKVAALVPILTGLGGVNVDWVVWSKTDQVSRPVQNWYVDNSWDTQRRRGPKATTRQQGTTSENDVPNILQLVATPEEEVAA